jgi:hypothetical protein
MSPSNQLLVGELAEAEGAKLAAHAGLLHAAERRPQRHPKAEDLFRRRRL